MGRHENAFSSLEWFQTEPDLAANVLHGRMNLPNAWPQTSCVETLIETHADEPQGS
jgi:hypothetical protein